MNRPLPPISASTTAASRTRVGSIPKYSAIPPQTPANILLLTDKVSRRYGRSGGLVITRLLWSQGRGASGVHPISSLAARRGRGPTPGPIRSGVAQLGDAAGPAESSVRRLVPIIGEVCQRWLLQ